MIESPEQRTGQQPGSTVVVDRGMAYAENLEPIHALGLHYIVAGRQPERHAWLADLEENDWDEVIRPPSPRHPAQQKSPVQGTRRRKGNEVVILCRREGREEQDRAIRHTHARRRLQDLEALKTRIAGGHLKQAAKIHQAMGRLQERDPRVARYDRIEYDPPQRSLLWQEETGKKAVAATLDGSYVLKTDRQDLTAEES